jgi:hypothetical protein
MFYSPKQLIIHRMKKFGPMIGGGLLLGVFFFALALMAISHEFTKCFVAFGVVAGILWWIADRIYWWAKIRKAEEGRRIDAENQRKRREAAEASVIVVRPRPRSPQVLFDYNKH